MKFTLVHSPALGPAAWSGVAGVLVELGHDIVVPDLRDAAGSGDPAAVVRRLVEATGSGGSVLVGHSGAGYFLPTAADGLRPPVRGLVFVDAGMPPCNGQATAGGEFLARLQALGVDGVLPKWADWWERGVLEALIPDEARRIELVAEMPEVPLRLYETPTTFPTGWCDGAGAYLLLSGAYRDDAARARSLGWPVTERDGTHLDIVTKPDVTAHDVLELVAERWGET